VQQPLVEIEHGGGLTTQVHTSGLFGCSPARQHAAQAAILTPGHQNRTPELAAWARQLCQGTKQTSPSNLATQKLRLPQKKACTTIDYD